MTEDSIRSTLVENLMLLYPDGPPADEKQIKKWLRELVCAAPVDGTSAPLASSASKKNGDFSQEQIYERAMCQAVQEWKLRSKQGEKISQSNKKPQKQSFSLFAQLDAASWGAPRITMDDLKDVSSPEERLSMLQKVAHVDDVALDWADVSVLLREGLTVSKLTEGYIELHRKWFGQGRASIEHWAIRCDLCQNTLLAIKSLVVSQWDCLTGFPEDNGNPFSAVHETVFKLWSLWNDMWFDLMQVRASQDGSKGYLEKMGRQVLLLLKSIEKPNADTPRYLLPAHFLALVDPAARWFRVWVAYLTPPQLIQVLHSVDLLPHLWQLVSSREEFFPKESKYTSSLFDTVLRRHSLSILNSILSCTRLKWFPTSLIWEMDQVSLKPVLPFSLEDLKAAHHSTPMDEDIVEEDNRFELLRASRGVTKDQVSQLFGLFLRIGIESTKSVPDAKETKNCAALCAEAIEVLLSGSLAGNSPGNDDNSFPIIWAWCQEQVSGATDIEKPHSFDALLSDIVQKFGEYVVLKQAMLGS